jgi:hypothetical protein
VTGSSRCGTACVHCSHACKRLYVLKM